MASRAGWVAVLATLVGCSAPQPPPAAPPPAAPSAADWAEAHSLASELQRTRRIEISSIWKGSRVVEVNDPREVAMVVSAMSARLDPAPEARLRIPATFQIHFVLDDGREVTAAYVQGPGFPALRDDTNLCFVRRPGEPSLHAYFVAKEIAEIPCLRLSDDDVFAEPRTEMIHLGRIQRDGCDVEVLFDGCYGYYGYADAHPLVLIGRVNCVWPVGQPEPRGMGDLKVDHLIRSDGSEVEVPPYSPFRRVNLQYRGTPPKKRTVPPAEGGQFSVCFFMPIRLDEVGGIALTVGGSPMTFKVTARYHGIFMPPCPVCGSEANVSAWTSSGGFSDIQWSLLTSRFTIVTADLPVSESRSADGSRCLGPVPEKRPGFFCGSCKGSFW